MIDFVMPNHGASWWVSIRDWLRDAPRSRLVMIYKGASRLVHGIGTSFLLSQSIGSFVGRQDLHPPYQSPINLHQTSQTLKRIEISFSNESSQSRSVTTGFGPGWRFFNLHNWETKMWSKQTSVNRKYMLKVANHDLDALQFVKVPFWSKTEIWKQTYFQETKCLFSKSRLHQHAWSTLWWSAYHDWWWSFLDFVMHHHSVSLLGISYDAKSWCVKVHNDLQWILWCQCIMIGDDPRWIPWCSILAHHVWWWSTMGFVMPHHCMTCSAMIHDGFRDVPSWHVMFGDDPRWISWFPIMFDDDPRLISWCPITLRDYWW